jgi:hypothetical protein
MSDEILYSTKFSLLGEEQPKEYFIHRNEVDAIVLEFQRMKDAHSVFLEYCQDLKNNVDEIGAQIKFQEDLISSINKVIGYGNSWYHIVLQELLLRQGIEVNWIEKWEDK